MTSVNSNEEASFPKQEKPASLILINGTNESQHIPPKIEKGYAEGKCNISAEAMISR
jgi:hypothetical protein